MRRKVTYALAAMLLLAIGGVLYALPYVTSSRLRAAAARGDAAEISEHVDFPLLRENMKAALSAAVLKNGGEQASASSGFGAAIASAIVDRMVDAMVTPEAVAMMMRGQTPGAEPPAAGASQPPAAAATRMGYEDLSTFVVTIERPEASESVDVVFRRRGLSWKVSEVRLPL